MGTRILVRAFAAVVAAAAICALAQAPDGAKAPRVGVVFWRIPTADLTGRTPVFQGARVFLESLRERGWTHGRNVEILFRSAEANPSRVDVILDEIIATRADALLLAGNDLVKAAMARTSTIPIVMLTSVSPVESGLVASLARPGANVTGMLGEVSDLNPKRLELLKQAAPGIKRVAWLRDSRDGLTDGITPATQLAARNLVGLTLLPILVETRADLPRAERQAVRQRADALFVDTSAAAADGDQPAFLALAERHKLPAFYTYGNAVRNGGLMTYGNKPGIVYERAAFFVDRILRGSKPADIPVEQPSAYHLILNLKAAKAIGLAIPAALAAQADQILD